MLLTMLQVDWFLSFFSEKPKTAVSWFFVSIAVGIAISGFLLALKYILKKKQGNPVWGKNKSWLYIVLGGMPIPLLLLGMQFADPDYLNYGNYGGGTLFAFGSYVFLVLLTHLLYREWRTELF